MPVLRVCYDNARHGLDELATAASCKIKQVEQRATLGAIQELASKAVVALLTSIRDCSGDLRDLFPAGSLFLLLHGEVSDICKVGALLDLTVIQNHLMTDLFVENHAQAPTVRERFDKRSARLQCLAEHIERHPLPENLVVRRCSRNHFRLEALEPRHDFGCVTCAEMLALRWSIPEQNWNQHVVSREVHDVSARLEQLAAILFASEEIDTSELVYASEEAGGWGCFARGDPPGKYV